MASYPEEYPITPSGLEKLKKELHELEFVVRPKISQAIGVAIAEGDLSENFEYHANKNQQGMVEARIRMLKDKLARARVIDPRKLSGDRVVFGATVELEDIQTQEVRIFQIVSDIESDVEAGRISVLSPVARALIGKHTGDEVLIPGRTGPRKVEIVDVRFV